MDVEQAGIGLVLVFKEQDNTHLVVKVGELFAAHAADLNHGGLEKVALQHVNAAERPPRFGQQDGVVGYAGRAEVGRIGQSLAPGMAGDRGSVDVHRNGLADQLIEDGLHAADDAGLALLGGFIPFLFIPALAVLLNGAAMGILSSVLVQKGANLGSVLLFGLAPHGVFEIPAFLYACSMGIGITLWLSRFIIHELSGSVGTGVDSGDAADEAIGVKEPISFSVLILRTLRSVLLVIIPLLILAALVESLITPWLIKTFIGDLSLL